MTLVNLFEAIAFYRIPVILILVGTPWITYLACYSIPGKREEPYLLSLNLSISAISMVLLSGYLAYATNTGGWSKVATEADLSLLFLPPYHLVASIWLSKQRLPLNLIPAFRTLQALVILGAVLLAFSWLSSKIHLVLFSRMPFSTFLGLIAVLLAIAYWASRRLFK